MFPPSQLTFGRILGPLRLAIVGALCLLHIRLAASVSRQLSTTVDELAHLTAGYAYWTQHDYRLQPENGNLPQRGASPKSGTRF